MNDELKKEVLDLIKGSLEIEIETELSHGYDGEETVTLTVSTYLEGERISDSSVWIELGDKNV